MLKYIFVAMITFAAIGCSEKDEQGTQKQESEVIKEINTSDKLMNQKHLITINNESVGISIEKINDAEIALLIVNKDQRPLKGLIFKDELTNNIFTHHLLPAQLLTGKSRKVLLKQRSIKNMSINKLVILKMIY
jgi:hypothetical protein